MKLTVDSDKYAYQAEFSIVEAYNAAVKDLVRKRLDESGCSWREFVLEKGYQLISKTDIEHIEEQLLAAGYRFEPSAMSSPIERPDAYKSAKGDGGDFCFEHPDAPVKPADAEGREQRGVGDNVVKYGEDISGTARYVCSSDKVLCYLSGEIPEDTIAIIEDSGGTLTAPVLEGFKAVLCAGGTTRSHLAILSREYGIPCLMNVKLSGVKEGDSLIVEISAKSQTVEDYDAGVESRARVWRVNGG